MPKYTIGWIEYHNPYNWADEELELGKDKTMDEQIDFMDKKRENGIKNILDNHSRAELSEDSEDDWVEIDCSEDFEANDIKSAKKYVINNKTIEQEVFSVFNEKGKIAFTEEDLENYE